MLKHGKRILSLVLCLLLVVGMLNMSGLFVKVSGADIISNPDVVIDIVVNVPADYPGTFLDFKEELTDKLVAEGMDPATFRIVSGAIKIDTTDNSNWYVYDHYNSSADYNSLGLNSSLQPYRAADNSYASGSVITIENLLKSNPNALVGGKCKYFKRHIASSVDEAGKAKMIFAGYGAQPLADFMIYPAASDSRRTFSFDIDASCIDIHTLTGAGFFVNTGLSNGLLNGYLLFYQFSTVTSGTIYLKKITNVNALNFATANATGATTVAQCAFTLDATTRKSRIDVDLQATSITAQQRNYKSDGTFSDVMTMFGGKVSLARTGYNGFGPMVGYASHGCSSLSSFTFSDLEMTYEASSFEVLQNIQYSEDAEYKYFINLAGVNADPSVPEEEEIYMEGLNRLNKNGVFYVSNIDDGMVLTNPTATSSGIGPNNGLYATDADYITQIAQYITYNYENEVKYTPVTFEQTKDDPIADFIIVTEGDDNKTTQVLTVHLQHFVNSSDKLEVKIKDTSMVSSNTKQPIVGWKLRIYDPDNHIIADTPNYVSSPESLPTYSFSKSSKQGKYIFELCVKDAAGKESALYQTFLTTYIDNVAGDITAVGKGNQSRAVVTLTDKGFGIDDDGVTLVEGVGSGILKYKVDNGQIVTLQNPEHSYSFEVPLTSEPFTITSWDECGNESTKTFVTCEIDFDNDGYATYYVLSGEKLGTLPEGPVSSDPSQHFQGWADENGTIVSSETVITSNTKLHALYTTETVTITFDGNGGKFGETDTTYQVTVPKGSKIVDSLLSEDDLPEKEGYKFSHWTYNGSAIAEQTATGNITIVGNYVVDKFTLIFDANGGNLGKLKEKEVTYGSSILEATSKDAAGDAYQGTYLPTKEGYLFRYWAIDKNGTAIPSSLKMPADTYTVYAKWDKDELKYIVSFDSNGGSPITDKSFYKESQKTYATLPKTNRSGYDFLGWYTPGNVKAEAGSNVYGLVDHTLTAKWQARNDTQYKIEYYFSTDSGYRRDDSMTIIRYGTTDGQCLVETDDYQEVAGYWFDEANVSNVITQTITGDGKATLKLYYNRYFEITSDYSGEGEIKIPEIIKEGETPVVTWKPADGYVTKRVIIDNVIRDDLLNAGSIDFEDITADHDIYIEFGPAEEEKDPSGLGETEYCQVSTRIDGVDGSCTITPTQTVKQGEDFTVEWNVSDGYYITSVKIGGREYDVDTNKIDFKAIQADQEVVITTAKLPSIGGGTTDGYYTVTTNIYGGNSTDTTVTKTQVVEGGDSSKIEWKAINGYSVYQVYVDGVKLDDAIVANGSVKFDNISKNHVVDVYFVQDKENFNEEYGKDTVTITTQLIGGAGEITGGAVIGKGDSYEVIWNPVLQTSNDPTSADYKAYEVYKVLLNGEEQTITGNSLLIDGATEDKEVIVYVRPAIYSVNVLKYGEGTVSASKNLYKGQSYNITAVPDTGYEIVKFVIDGVEQTLTTAMKTGIDMDLTSIDSNHTVEVYFSTAGTTEIPTQYITVSGEIIGCVGTITGVGLLELGTSGSVSWDIDEDYEVKEVKINDEVVTFTGNNVDLGILSADAKVEVITQKKNASDDGKYPVNPTKKEYNVDTEIIGGPATITSSAKVEEGNVFDVIWNVTDEDYIVRKIIIDGISRADLITGDGLSGNFKFEDVTSNHTIQVIVGKRPNINIDIDGDGIPDINVDTDGDNLPDINIDLDGDEVPDINLDTDNTGTWKPSTEGGNADGIWKPDSKLDIDGDGQVDLIHGYRPGYDYDNDGIDDSWKPSKDVYPNGLSNPGYDTDSPLLNVDTNGDGVPDINIDIDGDEIADINIDTDGDGLADINIDIDGNKKPDVNIDTDNTGTWKPSKDGGNADGILKPDTKLDTDGDGKVDLQQGFRPSYDFNGDGVDDSWNPSKNVYPNGKDKPGYDTESPMIDVDTNGDGKPDINIDVDGDGIADINIDTDGDGLPDINIDTDGNKKPDINIDTDNTGTWKPSKDGGNKDGILKPDTNLDTDGDGKVDVENGFRPGYDLDGDGVDDSWKPDKNVPQDGAAPGYDTASPLVNVDTNGDGEPDVNIDDDGDGEPDINIDTDADGKPDLNIDTDGDGKPDLNIDTDGDGVADQSVDLDGDGKPDLITPSTSDHIMMTIMILAVLLEISGIIAIIIFKRNGYARLK